MAAYDLEGLLDIVPIKRTELIGDALNTVVCFLQGPERAPDDPVSADPDEDESTEIDWWQHYGFLSRPPAGSEALIVRLGAQAFAIASRALQAAGFGALGEGDVAMYSIGGNVIRVNANGSVSILAPSGNKQMVANLDPKKKQATLLLGNGTTIQASESAGITLLAQRGDITLAAPSGNVQFLSLGVVNESPTIKLNMAATQPLTAPNTKANPGIFV